MKNDALKIVFEELVSVYQNLKAEVIVSEVNEKSKSDVDFLIKNKSSFSRGYRRDVISVGKRDDVDAIILNLSRNGLYDSLPEGLFHSGNLLDDNKSFADKRKKYRKEENDARAFFNPIENEFFNQRLNIEVNEKELLNNFYNLGDDFLIDFWKINKEIPKNYILKLIKLLPYCYKISGDLELTRLSLEKILNQKVGFTKKYKNVVIPTQNKIKRLGVTLVTQSEQTKINQPYLEVSIGPIKESDIETYVNNIGLEKFVKSFYDYFIPIELEVVTKFLVNREGGFVLNEKAGSLIGVTTRI